LERVEPGRERRYVMVRTFQARRVVILARVASTGTVLTALAAVLAAPGKW
jgi:hypothetical protein